MDIILGIVIGVLVLAFLIVFLVEFRIRRPDVIILRESNGRIGIRKGFLYPLHFSLPLKRTTCPIQLDIEVAAMGNLGVRIKLAGSVAASLANIQSLIRIGGWNSEAVGRAAEEVSIQLQGLVKEYAERYEIHALNSSGILQYLNENAASFEEKFGVELISLSIQSLEPVDPAIADSLRQQEQARIIEQTERLSHQARVAAARAKFKADEEIAKMEHGLELKKVELKQILYEKDSAMAHQRIEEELQNNRLRLAFEKEEMELLRNSPELLMLTPQAARLAEASQGLKNARTVISLNPQENTPGSELLNLFQTLLQKAIENKKDS